MIEQDHAGSVLAGFFCCVLQKEFIRYLRAPLDKRKYIV
jgi:hypothetical protein